MPRKQERATVPMALRIAYDTLIWLDERVCDFDARARANIGRRILDAAVDLIEALTDATYAPRSSPELVEALRRANRKVALLRLLVRGAADRHYLSFDQRDFATAKLVEVGRMVGGWLRSLERQPSEDHGPQR